MANRRKRKKQTNTIENIINHSNHYRIVYWYHVFLSTRDNVDELRKIENKSSFVSADNMPEYVKGAFISMEDERFYNHHGFDLKGTTRALFSTISDRDVQGGSTITQQVVKNYFMIMIVHLLEK